MNLNLTEIIFILDRSGSMHGHEQDTIGGYNAFLDRQRADQSHETTVTTVLFDDRYEILHNGLPVHEIVPLTGREYFTRGSTALLDAIGRSISSVGVRLSHMPEDERPGKVLFVITTDGYENASVEFTYSQIRGMITHQREKYGWAFMFLGADIEAEEIAADIGISRDHAASYSNSSDGIVNMFCCMSENVMAFKDSGHVKRDWKHDIAKDHAGSGKSKDKGKDTVK